MNTNPCTRRSFVECIGAALVSAAPFIARPALAQKNVAGPVVETHYGKVRGTVHNGIHSFKGIPYGASTAGKNRFMPPVKPGSWTGVRQAVQFGHWSPQNFHYAELEAPQAPIETEGTGEDCLVLNIWTPEPGPRRKRPVMLWNHGGAWASESGSNPWVHGEALSRRGDVVVITINHRLNVFGYCHLGDIGGEKYAASGLTGMLDIVAALEWVRDNIPSFGGDPGNVMVFGQSGGGNKTSTLLGMPRGKGLFHRAAVQSSGLFRSLTRDQSNENTRKLMATLGISANRVDEMQQLPVENLLGALSGMSAGPAQFAPFVDGDILPASPFDPVATPVAANIPILVGSTLHEQSFSAQTHAYAAPAEKVLLELDEAGLLERAAEFVGAQKAPQLVELYKSRNPGKGFSEMYFLMATDRHQRRLGSITIAERKSRQGQAPAYMYLFSLRSPAFGGKLGAPHTSEIPYVFDNTNIPRPLCDGSAAEKALAAKISDAWIQFARGGNPNHKGLPEWPAYNMRDRSTMVFDSECETVNDPRSEERKYWQGA